MSSFRMFVIAVQGDDEDDITYFELDEDDNIVEGGSLPQGMYQVINRIAMDTDEGEEILLGVMLDKQLVYVALDIDWD